MPASDLKTYAALLNWRGANDQQGKTYSYFADCFFVAVVPANFLLAAGVLIIPSRFLALIVRAIQRQSAGRRSRIR